jgi:hypothetical protein
MLRCFDTSLYILPIRSIIRSTVLLTWGELHRPSRIAEAMCVRIIYVHVCGRRNTVADMQHCGAWRPPHIHCGRILRIESWAHARLSSLSSTERLLVSKNALSCIYSLTKPVLDDGFGGDQMHQELYSSALCSPTRMRQLTTISHSALAYFFRLKRDA